MEFSQVDPVCLILGLAVIGRRRGGFFVLLLLAAVSMLLVNLPWLASFLPFLDETVINERLPLDHKTIAVVGNALAVVVMLFVLVRLVGGGDPRRKLAAKLRRKGDLSGAAEVLMQAGHSREAFELFRKERAWTQAAAAATDAGMHVEAAAMYRRAGGRHLVDACTIYRQQNEGELAQKCNHELAQWQMNRGHFEEAVEPWLRAGEPARAVRAAMLAMERRRLKPSQPPFRAAIRAAEATRDHRCAALLQEMESNWQGAANSWRTAGDHERAASNFGKAGLLDEAAREQAAAGHYHQSAKLRLQVIKSMLDRLYICRAQGAAGEVEATQLERQIRIDTDALIPQLSTLGMESEVIDVLNAAGRTSEAIDRLVDEGQHDAAAELARNAQEWGTAATLYEHLQRWGEASDLHELGGNLEQAAHCAKAAGEYERALQLFRTIGKTVESAECLASLGHLQDALTELHRAGELGEACSLLQRHPGPVPDLPDVILDMSRWLQTNATLDQAIACVQRAVRGVALQPRRLAPAVEMGRLLLAAGDVDLALGQVERVLAFDYSHTAARELKQEIEQQRSGPSPTDTVAVTDAGDAATVELPRREEQRYEILNELGRGGMGVVYKARDTRLEREVAIKVLRTTSSEEAARLEQEAKAAATLNHNGIVTVYDFEAGFDGYFIAMEYVPGETLDKVLKADHALVLNNLPGLLLRLAEAVAYAHSRRVIHRDLKPGNVILTPAFEVKILDFGIAARMDTDQSAKPSVVGTPFYMAPEQIRGKTPTPATDIYAFGATAFHLATGRPPFKKGNVIEAHLSELPPDPLELAPGLSPRLAEIILRCLEKKPEHRFASGAELREALATV